MTAKLLVIGHGLLGGALVRAAGTHAVAVKNVPWSDQFAATEQLRSAVLAHTERENWQLAWCAGAGTVGSDATALDVETMYLEAVLNAIPADRAPGSKLVLVSSAGGIHAAGTPDWITENTPAAPRSAYGHNKLRQELIARSWATTSGADLLIARPSNLYGPGQRLNKPQGLVSQALFRTLRREPITLSVPDETQRDYIYVDDAASTILAGLRQPLSGGTDTKLVCAGRSVTIAHLLRVVRAATGVEPRVIRRSSPASALQPRHLRFRSVELPDLNVRCRSLEAGIATTWSYLVREYARGALTMSERRKGNLTA